MFLLLTFFGWEFLEVGNLQLQDLFCCYKFLMSRLLTFFWWEFLEVRNLKLQDIDVLLKSTDILLYLYHAWLEDF
jgi:hypothetical protein